VRGREEGDRREFQVGPLPSESDRRDSYVEATPCTSQGKKRIWTTACRIPRADNVHSPRPVPVVMIGGLADEMVMEVSDGRRFMDGSN
jgi:hypothetical protein